MKQRLQRERELEQQKQQLEALRAQHHDSVNPVDQPPEQQKQASVAAPVRRSRNKNVQATRQSSRKITKKKWADDTIAEYDHEQVQRDDEQSAFSLLGGEKPRKRSKERETNKSREDSSLKGLTTKFIELMNAHNGVLDLGTASDVLGVQKRRIYDITNVFEGLGMIVKEGPSDVRYSNDIGNRYVTDPTQAQQEEILREPIPRPQGLPDAMAGTWQRLEGEIQYLEELLASMDTEEELLQEALKEVVGHRANSMRLYVTDQDVSFLPLVNEGDQILTVLTPHGTTMEIDRERGGSVHVDSQVHELEIYSLTGRMAGRTVGLDERVPSVPTSPGCIVKGMERKVGEGNGRGNTAERGERGERGEEPVDEGEKRPSRLSSGRLKP